jgi:antitoxin VapB
MYKEGTLAYTKWRMALSIRDPEAAELARELAALRKTNMTEAIVHALRSELQRERATRPLRERLGDLARKLKTMEGPNPREVTKEEIDAMWGQ